MTTLLRAIPILVVMLTPTAAEAALLISEGFEGPNTFRYFDFTNWQTIPNFVGPGFDNPPYDNKYALAKETSGCHGGSACIRLFGEYFGGTADLVSDRFAPQQELWITYWQKLSSTYEINIHHKWMWFNGFADLGGNISWQSWEQSTPGELDSRLYNTGGWSVNGPQFAGASTVLPRGSWFKWKIHVKLNSSGQSNGIFHISVSTNGVNYTPVYTLTNSNKIREAGFSHNIDHLYFMSTRSRGNPCKVHWPGPCPPGTERESFGTMWIDDIRIGTTEADVDSGGGSNSIAPPTNLHFSSN